MRHITPEAPIDLTKTCSFLSFSARLEGMWAEAFDVASAIVENV